MRMIGTSRLRRILPWLVLAFAGLVAAALVVIARVPSLSASALTTALGRLVEVERIEIRLGLMLSVEVRGLRVHEGMALDTPILLEAPRAVGRQAWPRVLAGQLVPLDWRVERPTARIAAQGEPGGMKSALAALDQVPLVALSIEDGTFEVDAGERGTLTLERVSVEIRRRALLAALGGSTSAVVVAGNATLVELDTTWEIDDETLEIDARFRDADLPRLVRTATGADAPGKLAGIAGGAAKVRLRASGLDADIDTTIDRLSFVFDGMQAPAKPATTQINVALGVRGDVITLRANPVALDDMRVTGTAKIDRRAEGRVTADLAIAPFSLGESERLTPLTLAGLASETVQRLSVQAEAGRAEEISVVLDLGYAELVSGDALLPPFSSEEVRVSARLSGGRLRARPEYPPLENVSGRMLLDGDRVEIEKLRMMRDGRALPTVDFEMVGVAHFLTLPPEDRALPEGPGVKLPGLGPAFTALGRRPQDETPPAQQPDAPGETVLRVRNLTLENPALVFPLRAVNGRLRFLPDRMIVDETHGVVAGGNASIDLEWQFQTNALDIRIGYRSDGPPPAPDTTPERVWLAGAFEMERARIGAWPAENLRGEASSESGVVALRSVRAKLAEGELRAGGTVDLTAEGHAPIDFEIELRGADAGATIRGMAPGNETVSGRAELVGRVRGRLDPNERFLARANATLDVHLTDGELAELPAGVQIARLPSLQGVRGLFGRALPYNTVTGQLALEGGTLECRDFSLVGPELRMLLGGTIDVVSDAHETDLVIVLLFLQTLDSVLGSVPIVSDVILGKNGNLLSASFRLRGPFDAMSVSLIPLSRLQSAAGWTGGLLRRLGSWVPGLGIEAPEGEDDEEPLPELSPMQPSAPAKLRATPGGASAGP